MTNGNGTAVPVAGLAITESRANRDRDRAEALRALTMGRQTLYALQLADGTVKIGCTADLAKRRRSYPGSEVLGFAFGEFEDEQAVHDRLRGSVARGREYYHRTAEVLSVVNEWRDELGLPLL